MRIERSWRRAIKIPPVHLLFLVLGSWNYWHYSWVRLVTCGCWKLDKWNIPYYIPCSAWCTPIYAFILRDHLTPENMRFLCYYLLSSILWYSCSHGSFTCTHLGWTNHLLPEPESFGLLPISPGCWCRHLHAERQCYYQSGGCRGDIGLELVGCLSIHKYCCEPQEESFSTLPCPAYVCICGFPNHSHWLMQCRAFFVFTLKSDKPKKK